MKWSFILMMVFLVACTPIAVETPSNISDTKNTTEVNMTKTELATFAGGCFWCMEPPFEKLDGVISVVSGYSGGDEVNPTYKEVSSGITGHRESVQITYNPEIVSYKKLLDVYWRQIDPTDNSGSFVDRGFHYTSAIYYHSEEQKELAEKSKELVQERFEKPVVTAIEPYKSFYNAEDYHQDYYKENSVRYKFYRSRSGRDQFIADEWFKDNTSIWAEESSETQEVNFVKPSDEELREMLTPLQYKVTQKDSTEPAFDNEYWDNKEEGIYVDIVSGEPLFSSIDQYKSGTGWPSFTKPLEPDNIITKKDFKLFVSRTEVRSKQADNHLGHVFEDGPEPTGLRYCMNSAALRFIPKDSLEEEGYGEYKDLFDNPDS